MTSPHPTNPTSNISLGSIGNNPLIWGNIALLAGVPWLLALSMAGLAVGDPIFPAWFEIFILGFPAIALVTWLQWQQPISPFSLWIVAKSLKELSDRDRQILNLVKQNQNGWYVTGWVATAVAIVMGAVFCKIYIDAPLAQAIAPFPAGWRLFGIVWAEIFWLSSNVLLQAGVSALRIKLTTESELHGLKPFAVEKIKNSFTSVGWRSPQLLKFFEEDPIAENDASKNDVPQIEPADQTPDLTLSQGAEELESNNFVTKTEPKLAEDPRSEISDVSLDEQIIEEIEELEISAIVAEESLLDMISAPEIEEVEAENIVDELNIEPTLDREVIQESIVTDSMKIDEEIESFLGTTETMPEIAESETDQLLEESRIDESIAVEFLQAEELESTELVEELKSELDLDVTDTIAGAEFEGFVIDKSEFNLEVADDVLVEEFEITAIAVEEFVIEPISELEIIQQVADSDIESGLDDNISETNTKDSGQSDAGLESGVAALDQQFVDDDGELESVETAKTAEDEVVVNPSLTSSYKKGLDFLKKSRKTGGSAKKQGFGKPVKGDHNAVSSPEAIESEPIEALEQSANIQPVAEIESNLALTDAIADAIPDTELVPSIEESSTEIEEVVAAQDNQNQDFDDELDELVTFNVYVENILKEYLEDADDTIEEVAKIDNSAEIPETLESLEPNEQVLVNDESAEKEVSESIDPSIVLDSTIEPITQENLESFTENLPDLANQFPEESPAKVSSTDRASKDSKYLVQEFLVDKFLARLEELNIADKANKENVDQFTDISPEAEVVDEFADLEALLDRQPLSGNSDAEDLGDHNS